MTPPRIAFVVNALEDDAPTRMTLLQASMLKETGWAVAVWAWSRGGKNLEPLTQKGIVVEVLGGGMIGNVRRLRQKLSEFRPQVVHAALVRPIIGVDLFRRANSSAGPGIIWLYADHGTHEWHERGGVVGRVLDSAMPRILNHGERVIAVSDGATRDLISRGVEESRIEVLPHGVDTNKFRRHPDMKPQASAAIIMGSLGNLRPVKGYDILIRALALVRDKLPSFEVRIWGEGEERVALERLTAESGLQGVVKFPGKTDRPVEALQQLDVYIQPSRSESFGLAVAEAMACELPVIATRTGGLSSLVVEGETGVLASPADADDLADALLRLYDERALWKSWGQRGRERIEDDFSLTRYRERVVGFYTDLTSQRGVTR